MSECESPNVFSAMISVLREKVDDHGLRIEIYTEIINIIEDASLVPSTHFMLGEDPAFDDAHKKREKEE